MPAPGLAQRRKPVQDVSALGRADARPKAEALVEAGGDRVVGAQMEAVESAPRFGKDAPHQAPADTLAAVLG